MRNASVDQLVMLLSADWFFPHWTAIQIQLPKTSKFHIQKRCREITRGFLAGAEDYYLISFGQSRLDETKTQFFSLLAETNVPKKTVEHLRKLTAVNHQTGSAQWMIVTTTRMLVRGHQDLPVDRTIPSLSPQIVSVLSEWHGHQSERFDFEQVCLESDSEWDRHLASLTPRIPTALEDYLQVALITQVQFHALQISVADLAEAERNILKEWYVAVSRKLTGADHVSEGINMAFAQ